MSTPSQPGKGKIAGYALLGVAAVAATMGIVSVASGGESRQTAQQTPTSQAPGTGSPGGPGASRPPGASSAPNGPANPTGPGAPPTGGAGQGGAGQGGGQNPTTKVIQPPKPNQNRNQNPDRNQNGGPQQRPPQPAGQQVGQRSADVRIYNNGTVKGLAERAAGRLRAAGYRVVSAQNYSQGVIPTTTVYYRPGTGEEATARSLASDLGARVEQRFPGIRDASPGVILILTNDYQS